MFELLLFLGEMSCGSAGSEETAGDCRLPVALLTPVLRPCLLDGGPDTGSLGS